jgi:hypothetical protein
MTTKGRVAVWGCGSAAMPLGKERLQNLADRLGVPVSAPTGPIKSGPNGLYGLGPFDDPATSIQFTPTN